MQRLSNQSLRSEVLSPAEWSLYIADFEGPEQRGTNRKPIWTGRRNACPSQAVLSDVLELNTSEFSLEDISVQTCKSAPVQFLPAILTTLCCNYWRIPSKPKQGPVIDVKRLQTLGESDKRSICGRVFSQGDIVWTCRQCAKDPTCVQCDQCFRKSDHEGHEVYFHRASGGGSGCCDCGDEEAWSRAGNCTEHNHPSCGNCGPSDPLENLPAELQKGVRAVVKGAVGVIVSYIICTVRGFEPLPANQFIAELSEQSGPIVARLHNDDVHSYDQVINALKAFGMTQSASEQVTIKVDKEGEAIVATEGHAGLSKLQTAHQNFLENAGLLLSLVPQSVVQMESRICAIFAWMLSFGALSDGLRRIITEELIASLSSSAHCLPEDFSVQSSGNCADVPNGEEKYSQYSGKRAFEEPTRFPNYIRHLGSAPNPLVAPVYTTTDSDDGEDRDKEGVSQLENRRLGDYSTDYSERLLHPFRRCHCDALSLMLIGSPYLSNAIKKCINDLIIQFQHDTVFKAGFSQQFTTLYPALYLLYCRNIGTAECTIFHTSVQVYTANSVITMMSSDGAGTPLRLLPEGNHPLMITPLLAATLQMVLLDAGCRAAGRPLVDTSVHGAFLSEHSIRTHRLSHLCRDLEYLTADSTFCTRLLCENVDRGLLDIWIDITTMLQNLDCYTRKADVHVEREDDRWQDAANLCLEVEAVSNNFVSRALLDHPLSENLQFSARRPSPKGAGSSTAIVSTPSPYVAPADSSHKLDESDLQAMRELGVALCSDKILSGIARWVALLDESPGCISPEPRTAFLGRRVAEFFCLQETTPGEYPIEDLIGVSTLPVSVHLPLSRFFCKVIHYASSGGVSFHRVVTKLKSMPPLDVTKFLEHPLRCLVFAAQVNSNMWRRNGYTAANLSYNYCRAPISKTLRDMDIIAVQLAAMCLGGDALLATLVSRFQLTNYLTAIQDRSFMMKYLCPDNWRGIPRSVDIREYESPLVSDLLRLLIITFTYVPTCLLQSDDAATDGWNRALKREIVHQILGGAQSTGQLQKVKIMVGSSRTISDSMLSATIEDTCTRRGEDEESSKILSLRSESFSYFDPEFPSLSNQLLATACDRVREHVKALIADQSRPAAFIPLISRESLPVPHKDMADVRAVLLCPSMFTLLHCALESTSSIVSETSNRSSTLTILSRVVHLVTLQIHVAEGSNYFSDAFLEVAAQEESASRELVWKVAPGCGRGLLGALADIWLGDMLRDDVLYHQGLGWILEQIRDRSAAGRALLQSKDVILRDLTRESATTKPAEIDNSPAAKMQRQKAAQQRALQEANKRAAAAMAAFASEMSDDEDDEDDDEEEDDEGNAKSGQTKQSSHSSHERAELQCIICREKKATPLGYLCFLQPSNVLRNSQLSSPDCPELSNVFRVVALEGCKVFTDPHEDAAVIHVLSMGDHVLSENHDGRWLRIKEPVVGWCCLYCNSNVPNVANNPRSASKVIVNLHPISDLQFSKYGGGRLHASVCGHTMHFDCWDMFYAANYARFEGNQRAPDLQAVDINRGESLCPLCKSVTNTLLPHVPSSTSASRPYLPCHSTAFVNGSESSNNSANNKRDDEENSLIACITSREQTTSLESCRSFIQELFARCLMRGKLSNDNMFFSSCQQQHRLPWDADTSNLTPSRNITLLQQQYFLWSTTAYTLLTAICSSIRDRSSDNASLEAIASIRKGLTISESDQTTLSHLLGIAWRSSTWMTHFNSFVSDPLSRLFLGEMEPLTKPVQVGMAVTDPLRQFISLEKSTKDELEQSLLSMPFESVATGFYPTSYTIRTVSKLAIQKGVAEGAAWPVLRIPLLAQDLYTIAVAVVSSAEDLKAFYTATQLLCIARLAQSLIEPAATGLIDYFANAHSRASGEKAVSGVKSDSKHSHYNEEIDGSGTANKRSRTAQSNELSSFASMGSSTSACSNSNISSNSNSNNNNSETKACSTEHNLSSSLTELRRRITSSLGYIATSSKAPQGSDLLAIVLDSWLPYLEFMYHLQSAVRSISGVASSEGCELDVSAISAASDRFLCNDAAHSKLNAKIQYASELMKLLRLPDLSALESSKFFSELLTAWGKHHQDYYNVISCGDTPVPVSCNQWIPGGSKSSNNNSSSSSSSSGNGGASKRGLGATSWPHELSTQPGDPYSETLRATLDMVLGDETEPSNHNSNHNLDINAHSRREGEDEEEERANAAMEEQGMMGEADIAAMMEQSDEDENGSLNDTDEQSGSDSDEENFYEAMNDIEEGVETEDVLFAAMQEAAAQAALRTTAAEGDVDTDELEPDWAGLLAAAGVAPIATSSTAAAGQGSSGANAPIWKLLGVYPINPTVDFPATALNSLATETMESENNNPELPSFLQLMPVRAPLQGSVTGAQPIVGYNGEALRYLYPDLSHMGLGMRHLAKTFIPLPTIYTDLYQMVKFPANEGKGKTSVEDPALCLVCGRILNAGNKSMRGVFESGAGECTLHARSCGCGIGVFFLVQQCQVLLTRGSRSVYWPSLYLDSSGEVNEQRGQNRPLFLSAKRYRKLEELYFNHQIAKEIVRKRASAESVIRLNWF